MKTKLTAAVAIFLSFGVSGLAHRLDEYLQATLLSVDKDHIHASMRLVPGVAVAATVLGRHRYESGWRSLRDRTAGLL